MTGVVLDTRAPNFVRHLSDASLTIGVVLLAIEIRMVFNWSGPS